MASETCKGPKQRTPNQVKEFFKHTDTPLLLLALRQILDIIDEQRDHEPMSLILGNWFIANQKQMVVEERDKNGELTKNPAILMTGNPVLRGPKKEIDHE